MKKDQGRAFVGQHRVIYVYHNQVDAIGDTVSTEAQTFQAVRTAITDIADTVRYIVNTLNGNYVVITADHGFVFTETAPGTPDRSALTAKPPGTVTAKKRYLIGYDLPESRADLAWDDAGDGSRRRGYGILDSQRRESLSFHGGCPLHPRWCDAPGDCGPSHHGASSERSQLPVVKPRSNRSRCMSWACITKSLRHAIASNSCRWSLSVSV